MPKNLLNQYFKFYPMEYNFEIYKKDNFWTL